MLLPPASWSAVVAVSEKKSCSSPLESDWRSSVSSTCWSSATRATISGVTRPSEHVHGECLVRARRVVDAGRAERGGQGVRVGRAQQQAGAGEQIGQPAGCDDRALGDDDEMVDGGLHLVEQMTGQQHRPATVGEVTQQPAHPGDALGVQSVRWFVQDQHLRLTDERLGDPEPLPHAEGVAAHPPIGRVGQPDEVQQLLHAIWWARRPSARRSSGSPARCARRASRTGSSSVPTTRVGLGSSTNGSAVDGRRPVIGSGQPDDHPQGRGLSRAVGPEEAGDGARVRSAVTRHVRPAHCRSSS